MKDKWINVGYDGDELKPHTEPTENYSDSTRMGEKYTDQSKIALGHD